MAILPMPADPTLQPLRLRRPVVPAARLYFPVTRPSPFRLHTERRPALLLESSLRHVRQYERRVVGQVRLGLPGLRQALLKQAVTRAFVTTSGDARTVSPLAVLHPLQYQRLMTSWHMAVV